jgi:biotin carboxyl carrier protein
MKFSVEIADCMHDVEVERHEGGYVVTVDGTRHEVDAHRLEADFYSILTDGKSYEVSVEVRGDEYLVRHGGAERSVRVTDPGRRARTRQAAGGPERVISHMPGKVVRVLVEPGQAIAAGQGILVLEAMKMENEIVASRAGRVTSVRVTAGQSVEGGAELAVVE